MLLEQLGGRRPLGYRAPAFSITRDTPWAYETLAELGFRYDSSQYDSPRIPSGSDPCRYPVPARAAVGTRDLGVPGHGLARSRPSGADRRRCLLARPARPAPTARAAAGRRRERPPCAVLPSVRARPAPAAGLAAGERHPAAAALAAWQSAQRNPGRRRVADRIRAIAQEFPLVSYEEAHGEVVERYGASQRSLSREGVLV